MHCQSCGSRAETRNVTFNQNIGLLVIRFPSVVQGYLCKRCVHHYFWKMTGISLVLGWWGIISFITNVVFIAGNVGTYLGCMTMSNRSRGH